MTKRTVFELLVATILSVGIVTSGMEQVSAINLNRAQEKEVQKNYMERKSEINQALQVMPKSKLVVNTWSDNDYSFCIKNVINGEKKWIRTFNGTAEEYVEPGTYEVLKSAWHITKDGKVPIIPEDIKVWSDEKILFYQNDELVKIVVAEKEVRLGMVGVNDVKK